MLAGEYCNRSVTIIGKHDSIRKASKLMRKHHTRDILVVELRNGERIPVGIITDRDIVIQVLAIDVEIDDISIEDVMSYKLITANENDDLMNTIRRMRINTVRRIPIVNQAGGLVGVLSTDDILDIITEQLMDIDQINFNDKKREKGYRPVFSHH